MIISHQMSMTTSSGAASGNSDDLRGWLGLVYAEPTTATTTYTISITDANSKKIFERKGVKGTLREQVYLPIKGIHTVAIAGASVDEAFSISLGLQEIPS